MTTPQEEQKNSTQMDKDTDMDKKTSQGLDHKHTDHHQTGSESMEAPKK